MNRKTIAGGFLITLEGSECSGKSTQSEMLAERLKKEGFMVFETREPGGTKVGEDLRHIVKHVCDGDAVCDEAELFIFCASRAQLMRKEILPFLEQGGIVVCDRFADSTTAYQGYARGFSLEKIEFLHRIAIMERWPDITFLLDLDVSKIEKRGQLRENAPGVRDRIEEESIQFYEKVRKGYLTIAEQNKKRIKVLDAAAPKETIHGQIIAQVHHALSQIS